MTAEQLAARIDHAYRTMSYPQATVETLIVQYTKSLHDTDKQPNAPALFNTLLDVSDGGSG